MDLRGHLDLLLLATLRDGGPAHGYAIMASLRERSLGAFDLPEGTVYPALYRGVAVAVAISSRPARHRPPDRRRTPF